MKVMLSHEGGGYKGTISALVGYCFEEMLFKYGYSILDLIALLSGCSTGSLQAGGLAAGMKFSKIFGMYVDRPEEIFIKNKYLWQPKYKKEIITNTFSKAIAEIGGLDDMQKTKTLLQINAVDKGYNEGNVYFKSWKPKCIKSISYCCQCSFSAPVYFGATIDEEDRKVYLDGGTGNSNCTLLECIIEAKKLGWLGKEKVLIINLGTGNVNLNESFEKVKKDATGIFQNLKAAFGFVGMARRQSKATQLQVAEMTKLQYPELFDYIDIDEKIPKELNVMDGFKFKSEYVKIGYQWWNKYQDEVIQKLNL
jgi:hypothetical protein